MKTLREHLLEQSREAAPERELAAMRARVLASVESGGRPNSPTQPFALECFRVFWRELVWPCRGLWSGLAAAWVVVLALNHTNDPASAEPSLAASEIAALHGLWREQQHLLATLARASENTASREGRRASDASAPANPTSEQSVPLAKPLGWQRLPDASAGELLLS
jgi:hypothetical protein